MLGRLRNSKRAALVALLLSLLAAPAAGPTAGEGAATASAASYQCTPWTSLTRPPESIWVHIPIKKGRRYKMGTRVQVDFKTYVERVVINEWGPNETHRAQLLAAAQIVKQYAWWYVTHPNKKLKDKNGDCFDIGSTVTFQLYKENATAKQEASDAARVKKGLPARLPLIRSAIEAIWPLSIWRTAGGRKGFAHTGYRAGRYRKGCDKYYTGFHLYQQNARRCVRDGETFEALIRRFYGPNIALYQPLPSETDATLVDYVPDPFAEPWSLPEGWSDGTLTEFRGDFDGDLFPEIATLRVWNSTDPVSGLPVTSAAMGSIERRGDEYLWRDDIWSVTDLAASGIDASQMQLLSADVNGDGADDLVIKAPTPAASVAAGGGQSGIWVALSEKRKWSAKRIQPPALGAPQLVGTSTAALSEIHLSVWDRNADDRDEIALFAPTIDGRLELSLLEASRADSLLALRSWWISDALLGAYAAGSLSAIPEPLGPQRDPSDGRRALRSNLVIEVTLGGTQRTIAISGATPNAAEAR
ncbi:MAG: hypothetical protein RL546_524 [Chloroflexota bacterium]